MLLRFISIVCLLLVRPVSGMTLTDGQEVSYCVYHDQNECTVAPCLKVADDNSVNSMPFAIDSAQCPYNHPQQFPVLGIYDKDLHEINTVQPGQIPNQGFVQQFLQNAMPQPQPQGQGFVQNFINQVLTHQQAEQILKNTSDAIYKRGLTSGNSDYNPKIAEWWLQRTVTDTPWHKEVKGLIVFKDAKGMPRGYKFFKYENAQQINEEVLKAKQALEPYMDFSGCDLSNGKKLAPDDKSPLSWRKNYKYRLAEFVMLIPILAGTCYGWYYQKKKINPVLEKLKTEKDPEERKKLLEELNVLGRKKIKILLGIAGSIGCTIAIVLKLLSKRDPLLFERSV